MGKNKEKKKVFDEAEAQVIKRLATAFRNQHEILSNAISEADRKRKEKEINE